MAEIPDISVIPNPSSGSVEIRLSLSGPAPVHARLMDASGRVIREFEEGLMSVGDQRITWDGRDDLGRELPSGVYFCRVRVGEVTVAERVTLAR